MLHSVCRMIGAGKLRRDLESWRVKILAEDVEGYSGRVTVPLACRWSHFCEVAPLEFLIERGDDPSVGPANKHAVVPVSLPRCDLLNGNAFT